MAINQFFLGWAKGINHREYYVRQLRDLKMSAIIEDFSAADLRVYGRGCGWALARAHARSGDAAMIAGYMGSSEVFDDGVARMPGEDQGLIQRLDIITPPFDGSSELSNSEVFLPDRQCLEPNETKASLPN